VQHRTVGLAFACNHVGVSLPRNDVARERSHVDEFSEGVNSPLNPLAWPEQPPGENKWTHTPRVGPHETVTLRAMGNDRDNDITEIKGVDQRRPCPLRHDDNRRGLINNARHDLGLVGRRVSEHGMQDDDHRNREQGE